MVKRRDDNNTNENAHTHKHIQPNEQTDREKSLHNGECETYVS